MWDWQTVIWNFRYLILVDRWVLPKVDWSILRKLFSHSCLTSYNKLSFGLLGIRINIYLGVTCLKCGRFSNQLTFRASHQSRRISFYTIVYSPLTSPNALAPISVFQEKALLRPRPRPTTQNRCVIAQKFCVESFTWTFIPRSLFYDISVTSCHEIFAIHFWWNFSTSVVVCIELGLSLHIHL